MMGIFFLILLIPVLFALTIGLPILLGVLVYRDASRREDCSPWLWALVAALVPGLLGAVIYLVVRRDYPLKPEYQRTQAQPASYASGEPGSSSQETPAGEAPSAYDNVPTKTGMPTWGKALIIIGAVIVVASLIALGVSAVRYVSAYIEAMYSGGYPYGF